MKIVRTAVLVCLVVLGGCSGRYSVGYDSRDSEDPHDANRKVSKIHVPPGHLPPPGSCRIWLPGTPPGHQSPPGDCGRLVSQVPPGAWLLTRTAAEPELVEVTVYDEKRPGVVIAIEVIVAATGDLAGDPTFR